MFIQLLKAEKKNRRRRTKNNDIIAFKRMSFPHRIFERILANNSDGQIPNGIS